MDEIVQRLTLEDVGTRGEHIIRLRDNWQAALNNLQQRPTYRLDAEEKQLLTDLQTVLDFVDCHLEKDFIDIEKSIRKG
jgi:hypothetical protein